MAKGKGKSNKWKAIGYCALAVALGAAVGYGCYEIPKHIPQKPAEEQTEDTKTPEENQDATITSVELLIAENAVANR